MKLIFALLLLFAASAIAEHPDWNRLPSSADRALAAATEITLFSIRPEPLEPPRYNEGFHGYEVLGSVVLRDPAVVDSTRKLVRDSVAAYDDENYTCCFNPRHGLRVRTATQTFDFVICFECAKLFIYAGKEPAPLKPYLGVRGAPKSLDEILAAHKIPLPPPPKNSK
jgi:hypothetical protein